MAEPAILSVEGLSRRYGGVVAVHDVTFDVPDGSITALIGPNGAGKTTTLNVISGLIPPSDGRVRLRGDDMAGLRSDQICRRGIARTFQTPQVFRSMSVRDNVIVGTTPRGRISLIDAAVNSARLRREEQVLAGEVDNWLKFVGLEPQADRPISELPFGRLRLVEIARALSSKPALLLMDEPSSGLSRRGAELRSVLLRISTSDHDPAGRTQHAACDVDGRRRPRARQGPVAHRRDAGRGAGRPACAQGLSRDGWLIDAHHLQPQRWIRAGPSALRRVARGPGGAMRRRVGAKRRRQDHAAARDLGLSSPTSGTIEFDGQSIGATPPHQIVKRGISQVFRGGRSSAR